MKPIRSPIECGDVSLPRWYHGPFTSRWRHYFASLKRQLDERGPIPVAEWGDPERLAIAQQIEAILAEACWGERLQFHPDDPWRIAGKLEIGDLSELDALFRIQKRFRISLKFDELKSQFLSQGGTFGDFVDLVRQKQSELANRCN